METFDWRSDDSCPDPSQAFIVELTDHRLQYHPGGSTLIVAFDNAARPANEPYEGRKTWGQTFYLKEGHSLLGVIARNADWYRREDLIAALESLADQGFFRLFDKVVLTGGSMGGFAAMAFAPLAPGCTVIAFTPQSTLDLKLVPFETRYLKGVREDWTLPYSDAAQNVVAAGKVYVVYDSLLRLDRLHVERLAMAEHIIRLPLPAGGHGGTPALNQMGVFRQVTQGMIAGRLTAARFSRAARRRRKSFVYYTALLEYALARKHFVMAEWIMGRAARNVNPDELSQLRERITKANPPKASRRLFGAAVSGQIGKRTLGVIRRVRSLFRRRPSQR